jgi:L-iditol 2-dehydrogenase
MHAAVFYSPNNIAIEDIPFSKPDKKGVILRVKACAICGYDARVFRNGHQKVTPPIILGHELCGESMETITMAKGKVIKAGTRVAVSPIIPCLICEYCHNKQYNLCINLREIGSTIDGGFAEYVKIPEEILRIGGLISIPDTLSSEEAALLEPLACCLNGFFHIGAVTKESSVVIIGDGPIGLLHLQLSKKLYGAKTILVGKIPARIQKAKSMGADRTVIGSDSNETMYKILDFTHGIGANIVIIATSNPIALSLAIKIASKNSKINIFAGMPNDKSIPLNPNWLHYNQISITGSFSSTPTMLQKAVRLVVDKKVNLSRIVSQRYSLNNIKEAMLATEKYCGFRSVINRF